MMTEAFTGATAPITCTGDHTSGLFPDCHVVPRSTFNLVALGPYLDSQRPDHAVVLTSTSALELANVNFDTVANSTHPASDLIRQLQSTDSHGNFRIRITNIGTRAGPGSLYNTHILDRTPPHDTRTKLINSAATSISFSKPQLTSQHYKQSNSPSFTHTHTTHTITSKTQHPNAKPHTAMDIIHSHRTSTH